jgi:hypothetical protein
VEVEVEEVEVEVEEVEVEEVEVEEALQQEGQRQGEEQTRNSLERNHPPLAETDKMSTVSYRTSWDTCPSTETTQLSHRSSLESTSRYPSSQEKKCATGKTACVHGPTIS